MNCLVLDGSLDPVLFERVLPRAARVEIHPERHATVYQACDRAYSHNSIAPTPEKGGGRVADPRVVAGIRRLIGLLEVQGHQVALLAPMVIEDAVDHPLSGHFQALRGLNRLEGCTAGVVVGRTLPPVFEVEAEARALFPFDALDLNRKYQRAPLGYRMRDGSHVGVSEWIHPDPKANRVLRQRREAEVAQAVDRLRLVHCKERKVLVILGRLPVDVTVDHLIADPLEGRLLEGLEASNWALPLSQTWLYKRQGHLWKSEKAAKEWVSRLRLTGPVSLKDISFLDKRALSARPAAAPPQLLPGMRLGRIRGDIWHRRKPRGAPLLWVDRPPPGQPGPVPEGMVNVMLLESAEGEGLIITVAEDNLPEIADEDLDLSEKKLIAKYG
jgi:hypothetical protein